MIYSFGGYGSGGQNFELLMKQGEEWKECSRSHTKLIEGLTSEGNLTELVNATSLYFD
jgi:hypothetical protein